MTMLLKMTSETIGWQPLNGTSVWWNRVSITWQIAKRQSVRSDLGSLQRLRLLHYVPNQRLRRLFLLGRLFLRFFVLLFRWEGGVACGAGATG